MYFFLIPLIFGFACNLASAFTTAFSRRWGERFGSIATVILRDVLGIPVWAIGYALAVRTPSPVLFGLGTITKAAGWLMIAAGGAIILVALATIQLRALRPSVRDTMVQSGIYTHVRHPIHTGTFLEFLGVFLVVPTLAIALACALGIIWVLVQTRLEEIDLLERLPVYRDYMNAVPRFFPRFRMK
jgi:protein-S-isoprenylcysteine O-methyltransferase Ste14